MMRLRQYLSSQDVEVVLPKDGRAAVHNGGQTFEDLVLNAEKTQSLRKSHDMVRYYEQQIDNIFRRQAVRKILETALTSQNFDTLAKVVEMYEPFFVTSMADNPFIQFGKLKQKIDTKKILHTYLEKRLTAFKDRVTDVDAVRNAEADATAMRAHLDAAQSLPEKWEEASQATGVEQEIALQAHVMINQETTIQSEIEEEVDIELKRYEQEPANEIRIERDMTENQFLNLLDKVRTLTSDHEVISLQDQLKKFHYGLLNETYPYENIFSEQIFGTKAYFYTCQSEKVLPVFHKLQRPSYQILAVRVDDTMRWLLLTEHEAKFARDYLQNMKRQGNEAVDDVWLIQPDGSQYIAQDASDEMPALDLSVEKGLLEINAFAGNADYLDQNTNDTEAWLQENTALKIRFLKLRTARNQKQHQILRRSPCIAQLDQTHPLWGRLTPVAVRKVHENKINTLAADKFQYLKEQKIIRRVSFWNVVHLTRDQLRKRSKASQLAYGLGILILGVASCVVAAAAYVSLIPLTWLASRQVAHRVISKVNANPYRLYRLFEVYLGD